MKSGIEHGYYPPPMPFLLYVVIFYAYQITKVVWSFNGTTKNYMLDYDGNKANANTLDNNSSLSVTVKWDGYTNASPDGAVLNAPPRIRRIS